MTPTDLEDRLRRDLAREAARTRADMLRQLAEPRPAGRRGRAGLGFGGLGGLAGERAGRRWLAPVAAVIAVAAVLAGVSLAGVTLAGSGPGSRPGAASGGAAARGVPRFYASVTLAPRVRLLVHRSGTGRVVASVGLERGAGPMPSVAASADDRTFAVAATEHLPHSELAVRLLLFRISASGRPQELIGGTLLTAPGSADIVTGLALSPDARQLAATVESPTTGFHPLGRVELISLTHFKVIRTWSGGAGIPSDPAWAGDHRLGFLWWDQIRGPVANFTARTRERLLDTTGPGTSLLGSSRVLAAAPGGRFLQTAVLAPDGRTVLGTWYRNIPDGHGNGTAVLDFGQLSRSGRTWTVLQQRRVRFRGTAQEGAADATCNVLSVAGRDNAALVQCPGLERVQHGRFGSLPSLGPVPIAAW